MNLLNQCSTYSPLSWTGIDPVALFPRGCVVMVRGQIRDRTLGWAGRISCTLRLSVGDLTLHANRDTLPLHIVNDSWVQVKLMRRLCDELPAMQLLSASVTAPEPGLTSWLPVSRPHHGHHLLRLRHLLGTMTPGLQAIFMAVMADARLEPGFLQRVAASDHHVCPGGHFDQCVEAAELAYRQPGLDPQERGLAALGALLFDLGKILDQQVRPDRSRCGEALVAHSASLTCLEPALCAVSPFEPVLVESVRALFAGGDLAPATSDRELGLPQAVRQAVRQAVQQSWCFDDPASLNAHGATELAPAELSAPHSEPPVAQASEPAPAPSDRAPQPEPAVVVRAAVAGKLAPRAFSVQWAAGFADGEGSICIVKQTYTDPKRRFNYRLVFSIVQNNLQVLEQFLQGLGIAGAIYAVKRTLQHNKQVYTLNYSGVKALQVIAALEPYLVRKLPEAQAALAYWVHGLGGMHPGPKGWPSEVLSIRESYYQKLRRLK